MWRVFHLKYTTFLGAASLEPVATPFHTPGINLHSMPTNTYPLSRCPAPKIFSQAYAHCMHAVCHHAVDPAFPFILHPCFCSFISCVFMSPMVPYAEPFPYELYNASRTYATVLPQAWVTPPPLRPARILRWGPPVFCVLSLVTLQQVHFRGALYSPVALPPCDPSFTGC